MYTLRKRWSVCPKKMTRTDITKTSHGAASDPENTFYDTSILYFICSQQCSHMISLTNVMWIQYIVLLNIYLGFGTVPWEVWRVIGERRYWTSRFLHARTIAKQTTLLTTVSAGFVSEHPGVHQQITGTYLPQKNIYISFCENRCNLSLLGAVASSIIQFYHTKMI